MVLLLVLLCVIHGPVVRQQEGRNAQDGCIHVLSPWRGRQEGWSKRRGDGALSPYILSKASVSPYSSSTWSIHQGLGAPYTVLRAPKVQKHKLPGLLKVQAQNSLHMLFVKAGHMC